MAGLARRERRSKTVRSGRRNIGAIRIYGRSLPPHPNPWGEGEDGDSVLTGFVEKIVVSYGLADIFPGSEEAVLVENDNRRVKRRPLVRELTVEGAVCRLG
jgi:hypothetical protein